MCYWQEGHGRLVCVERMQEDGFYDETSRGIAMGGYPSE